MVYKSTKANRRITLKGFRFLTRDLGGILDSLPPVKLLWIKVEQNSGVGGPYPRDHELMRLNVTYGARSESVESFKSVEYLREHGSSEWYRCKNYKKVGKPL
ncbi:hypothetical protein HYT25_01270 [Candidatus Pacearchaeota archaeon]|nr:hypothetical protein [Candidatus Pacearchaeota archaeon]